MAAAASSSAASARRSAWCSSCCDWRFVDAGTDLVERALHRGLGLVPPRAAGFGSLADGGVELADSVLKASSISLRRCLELRAIRLECGGRGVLEHLGPSGELLQGLGQWFHGFLRSHVCVDRGERKPEGVLGESTKTPVSARVLDSGDGVRSAGRPGQAGCGTSRRASRRSSAGGTRPCWSRCRAARRSRGFAHRTPRGGRPALPGA